MRAISFSFVVSTAIAIVLLTAKSGATDVIVWGNGGSPFAIESTSGDPIASTTGLAHLTSINGTTSAPAAVFGGDIAVAMCMHWEPTGMPSSSANSADMRVGYGGTAIFSKIAPTTLTQTWVEAEAVSAAAVADYSASASASASGYSSSGATASVQATGGSSSAPSPGGYWGLVGSYSGPMWAGSTDDYYSYSQTEGGVGGSDHQDSPLGGTGWAMGAHIWTRLFSETSTYADARWNGSSVNALTNITFGDDPGQSGPNGSGGATVHAEGSSGSGLSHSAVATYMHYTFITFQ